MTDGENAYRPNAPARPEPIESLPVRAPASSRVIRSVVIFAAAGVVLYGIAAFAADYRAIVNSLKAFPPHVLAVVIGLVLVGWVLRGARFHYYLKESGVRVPFRYALETFLAGFALTGTPGKVGEAVKAVFLKEDYGVPVTQVVGILLVERLMDLWGVLLLGSFSLLLFRGWEMLFLLCAAIVIAGGMFLSMERMYRPVLERLSRIRFLTWICNRMLGILLTGKGLMNTRVFLVGLAISTVSWGMESLAMYLILRGFELPATLLQANFVYCFSTIVGALSMLPGGIGGTEAGMVGLLAFMGIPYSAALAPVILIRLCTLWFAVVVGLGFMIALLSRSKAPRIGP